MRYLLALLILVGGSAGGYLFYRHLTAGPAVVLPIPTRLQATANDTPLLPDGWTNSPTVTLTGHPARQVVAGADFEVRPLWMAFTNQPTASSVNPSQVAENCKPNPSCANPALSVPAVRVRLADGVYHWQVRLHNRDGISPWEISKGVIRVDTQPPIPPSVGSSTNPNPNKVYHSSTLRFSWQAQDSGSGIAGYSYRLDANPHGQAKEELRTQATSIALNGLQTGSYYFHVRALDRAGNWGPETTFPVGVDVTPPGLAAVRFSEFDFNPQFSPLHVSFTVTRPATIVRVGVYRQSDGSLVRMYHLGRLRKGETGSIWWHGRNGSGGVVPAGAYMIYVRAVDQWGHSSLTGWNDFVVNYKRIVVSLSQQRMTVYDGDRVIRTSLVTTGNRALPTPTGTYSVMAKFHPFTFHSPWPKSSPYYYAPSKVEYALLFREGGYFIHDAPWRSAFGPGTNSQLGTPGTNYTGTHGCVNVPPDVAAWLYGWAPEGTMVQVVN